jgi:hypothetical protein
MIVLYQQHFFNSIVHCLNHLLTDLLNGYSWQLTVNCFEGSESMYIYWARIPLCIEY